MRDDRKGVSAADESTAQLTEVRQHGEQTYRGRFLDVRCDHVALPDGKTATREYIIHPGAAVIVPLLGDDRVVLERQYRYPVGQVMVEFPAGKLDVGESSLQCAVRELREETGYTAQEWAYAGVLHNAIAYSTEGIEVWFARGLSRGEAQLDDGEFLEVFDARIDDLEADTIAGRVTDAKTLICLAWLRQWQRGQRTLVWRSAVDGVLPS